MTTVVLSGIPYGCQEADIHRALLMYGIAVEIQIDARAARAVVTMRTVQEAQALLNRRSVNVLGSSVRVDVASQAHQQPPPMPTGNPAQGLMQPQPPHPQDYDANLGGYNVPPMPQGRLPNEGYGHMNSNGSNMNSGGSVNSNHNGMSIMPMGRGDMRPERPSTRLRVVVEDCRYPITREVLMQMFSMISPPVQVHCGPSGNITTGSVEYADVASAERAMQQFNNNAIYPNCCYVKLSYEPPSQLPPLPRQQQPPQQQPQLQQQQQLLQQQPQQPAAAWNYGNNYYADNQPPMQGGLDAGYDQGGPMPPSAQPPIPSQPQTPQQRMYRDSRGEDGLNMPYYGQEPRRDEPGMMMMPEEAMYGNMGPAGGPPAGAHYGPPGRGAGSYFTQGGRGGGGRGMMRGRGGFGGPYNGFSPYGGGMMQGVEPMGRGRMGGPLPMPGTAPMAPYEPEATVIVSNVDESVALYDLWVLLEVYGNVNSLKRQFREKTNVVAQFQHEVDARSAVSYLQSCSFRGRQLSLKHFAGYVERGGRTVWNEGKATDPATHAVLFTSGYHHRTKPSAPFNRLGRVRPSQNLFVSNLTEGITDDALKAEFARGVGECEAYYRKTPVSAVLAFKNIETAIDGLIYVHGKELLGRFLRVTFSRFPPGPRAEGEVDENEEAEDASASHAASANDAPKDNATTATTTATATTSSVPTTSTENAS